LQWEPDASFTARQSPVLAMIDSVWPSDRLSESDRPSVTRWYHAKKRLQLRSCGLHLRIAPWLQFPHG